MTVSFSATSVNTSMSPLSFAFDSSIVSVIAFGASSVKWYFQIFARENPIEYCSETIFISPFVKVILGLCDNRKCVMPPSSISTTRVFCSWA